ncbi:hypothetical protein M9Y10_018351 [Tritrichomonas musculus]|uniref:Lecithin:cholesterol acyltransferase family protein n=1 Tax=Tritrichomonas musculus TaxID=1915356 RepID=A0ABR2HPW2_9EUKA
MLFFLLQPFISSLKPVIFIPGTYASVLKMTGDNLGHQWYCPKSLNNQPLWINEFYFIPPIFNCVAQWLKIYYDPEKDEQTSHPNAQVDVIDFGTFNGMSYIDKFFSNFSILPYYSRMFSYFRKMGYREGVDLFGAPLDWRMGLAQNAKVFHPRLINLIEDIHKKTNQKVVLFGHSFGGYSIQNFLANGPSQEWIDKHIEKGVALSPSFGGAIESMSISWTRQVSGINNQYLAEALEGMGAVHIHYLNWDMYPNKTVLYTPDNKEIKNEEFPQFLIDHKRVNGDAINLLRLNQRFFSKFPNKTKAPLYILYNSAQNTPTAFRLKDWNSSNYENIYGEGDGTVNAEGIRMYCDRYSHNTHCYDFKDSRTFGSHFMMLYQNSVIQQVYQTVLNNSIF